MKIMFTLGGAIVVLCVVFRINVGRRITSAAYEGQLRKKMGLPPAGREGAVEAREARPGRPPLL